MLNKKEILIFILAALVMGYALSFKGFSWLLWPKMAGLSLLIILVHSAGQKLSAKAFHCSTESKLWTFTQYWFTKRAYFKKPFPAWLFVPLLLTFASLGYIKWLALTTFEVTALPSRAAKGFARVTEWHLALIAAAGLFFNIFLAFFSQLLGFHFFAALNLYFVLFNLLPISTLDGTKVFFGSRLLWIFSVVFAIALLFLFEITGLLPSLAAALLIAIAAFIAFYYFVEAK